MKVPVVLLPGQVLADAAGHTCTSCGQPFRDGERAVCTRPAWPDTRRAVTWICAACYRPPGRNERFTDSPGPG